MRKLAILVVVGLVAAHVSVTAQRRPSFSGVWTLLAERTTPPDAMPLGPQINIEQTAATLTIVTTAMRLNLRVGQSSVSPGGLTSTAYELDGAQHVRPESGTYRATWTEDQLVIMTRDARRFTVDGLPPVVMERVIRQALSLDGMGNLVMDTLIVADPVPLGPRQDPPIPMRAVYRRLP